MARYRRRRYYRKRARYSPNIVRIGPSSFNIPAQDRDFGVVTLIENQSYDPSRSNTIITVKNPELSIDFDANQNAAAAIESCTAYIMFVPEGYVPNIDTPILHPEWIMAYKFFGSPNWENTSSGQCLPKYVNRIRTRLSRKLNTGDRIILFIEGSNINSTSSYSMQYQ